MSGHSRIYQNFTSWKTANTPVPPEIDPLRAFNRLFKNARVTGTPNTGGNTSSGPRPDASVLDLVLEDAKALERRLGSSDKQKLEEYLTAVREVEVRAANASENHKHLRITSEVLKQISGTGSNLAKVMGKAKKSIKTVPDISYQNHIRLQLDVLALAFWSNTTRSGTFMFGDGLNGRNMTFIDGVQGNHHSCSHHGDRPDSLEMFSKINTFFIGEYARFLKKLEGMTEGSTNVLENSLCLLGSNLNNGQQHFGNNMTALTGGHAGGNLSGNRHIKSEGAQMSNLLNSCLDKMDVPGSVGAKSGKLKGFS